MLRAKPTPRAAHKLALLVAVCALLAPAPAAAQRVRASNFADVDFGMLGSLQTESRRSQNLCIYSNGATGSYSVSAVGSGPGSEFSLSSGSFTLPYAVEWSDSSGQPAGTSLTPNVALTGQVSSAKNQLCSSGPVTSASLTIVLRPADLSIARQGTYGGSLTIIVAAE